MAFRDRNSRGGGDRGGFRSRPSFGDRPRFGGGGGRPRFGGGGDRGPVEMHDAICDNCGKSCQVPFRPTQGKPVYCSDCFENQRGSSDSRGDSRRFEQRAPERSEVRPSFEQPNYSAQFEALSSKLDKIISLLSPEQVEKPAKKAKVSKKAEE